MTETAVKIPYWPRYPQDEIHRRFDAHRFCVLVAHRRMGKTVLAVNHLIKRAIVDGKERGFYAYIAPFRVQAKAIAWSYLKHYTSPIPYCKINEGELSIILPNRATIRIFGADNPDALRGLYFDGVVMDEVAQMKPEVWGEIIRPALADRKGWAVFIGTPKGINLFSQMYDLALAREAKGEKEWKAMVYGVEQTRVIPEKELDSLRKEMSENEYRQEFLCDFNAASDDNLISIDTVRAAAGRHYAERDYSSAPVVLGVDVARFGSDSTVIFRRQGLVAFPPIVIRGLDNMEVADRVAIQIAQHNPAQIFIDAGEGTGVIDRLRQMRFNVAEVYFGGKGPRKDIFENRRMEMWWEMKQWLEKGGAIPPDEMLQADLAAPTYGFTIRGTKILEPKDKIKERIGRSPDMADALALTFAAPVPPQMDPRLAKMLNNRRPYDPERAFDDEWRSM